MLKQYHSFQPTLCQSGLNRFGIKCQQRFPSEPLENIVYSFIQINIDQPTTYPVIPDGMINLFMSETAMFISGMQTQTQILPLMQTGKYFGIRFYPGALSRLFNLDMEHMNGQHLTTDIITDSAFSQLLTICFEAKGFEQAAKCCEQWFINKTHKDNKLKVNEALNLIVKHHGAIKVQSLSDSVNLSARQLNRQFLQYVGVNTKTYSQIIRLQQSVKQLLANSSVLNANNDYYDQSHQTHSYQRFLSITPQSLLKKFS
ncbi:DUF6597 domain-containing transcriptional factor [Marinicellulosiphila megalodicopiae]|uniref:DUF6597 domain-containing transcriptional factor n=1 Tax=Marinicellulosiphila megalodicopiae TaxID=2724896 RepID=UPI003BB1DCBE